jgi:hypothetical protein
VAAPAQRLTAVLTAPAPVASRVYSAPARATAFASYVQLMSLAPHCRGQVTHCWKPGNTLGNRKRVREYIRKS